MIRRQFRAVEGDPFNPREIRESAERIRALGFFSKADVTAREGSSADQVIVDVDVEEQPTGSLGFGATYSAATGIGFTISFSERNFLGPRPVAVPSSRNRGRQRAATGLPSSSPDFWAAI